MTLVVVASGYAVGTDANPWRDSAASVTTARGASPTEAPQPVVTAADRRATEKTQLRIVRKERKARQLAVREAKERAKRQAALKKKRQEARRTAALESTPYTFKIGSFNVLGSQHTGPRGQRQNFPSAAARTPRAASLARNHGVDILGTQELQEDQLAGLTAQTGMAAWPGRAWGASETHNSILYDPSVFEFVAGESFNITFMSRSRPQPILRLRHRKTSRELYVVNTHPSAGEGKYAVERDRGYASIVSVVNRLQDTGLPVLLTGDMNDRERFYCNVVGRTALTASSGGGAGCAPPPGPVPVDWVVGSGVSWSGYQRDTSPVTQKISDHFFISATATVN